jgi:hypothetical protein
MKRTKAPRRHCHMMLSHAQSRMRSVDSPNKLVVFLALTQRVRGCIMPGNGSSNYTNDTQQQGIQRLPSDPSTLNTDEWDCLIPMVPNEAARWQLGVAIKTNQNAGKRYSFSNMTAERTRDFESLYSSARKIRFVAENLIVIPDSIVEIATDQLSSGPSAAQHLDVFLFSQHCRKSVPVFARMRQSSSQGFKVQAQLILEGGQDV